VLVPRQGLASRPRRAAGGSLVKTLARPCARRQSGKQAGTTGWRVAAEPRDGASHGALPSLGGLIQTAGGGAGAAGGLRTKRSEC
jgi:hypothetical protein